MRTGGYALEHEEDLYCSCFRVDDLRMAYGYNPSFIAESHKCTETKGYDELGEVCRKMMDEIGSNKKLWVAMVSVFGLRLLTRHG